MTWKKVRLPGNEKPVEAYQLNGYTICLNINNGLIGPGKVDKHGHYWVYEITEKINGNGGERVVGTNPTLNGAKLDVRKREEHGDQIAT